jgi:hypothetical protein
VRIAAATPIAPSAAATGVIEATQDAHDVHVPGQAFDTNATAPTAPAPSAKERTASTDGRFIASVRR